eukprot:TRINITY_DN7281_c0_g2_i1.p1 TRINITY_DN7281_c0_g2~~TRINITY_DN7281_c0_g2_i1.p1  ORF type:complete len:324 (+),score=42.82 TRINITY_DN7281_c0_g2_i1:56-973(+)
MSILRLTLSLSLVQGILTFAQTDITENQTSYQQANQPLLRGSVCPGCQQCAAESQQCRASSWMIWIPGLPCCAGMECKHLLGGGGSVCVAKQAECVKENGICGGSGQKTQTCCGNSACKQLLGGSQMKCVANHETQCVPMDGICGGPGQLTQTCCGAAKCQTLLGGSQMRCTARQTSALFALGEADQVMGATPVVQNSSILAKSDSLVSFLKAGSCPGCQQCAAKSQQCRPHAWMIWIPGLPCCGGMECTQLLGGSGRVCVEKQPQCVDENGICGGPRESSQSCCGNSVCRQLLGGSQMKCVPKD